MQQDKTFEWATPGTRVAVRQNRGGRDSKFSEHTVARVTKTLIVLDDDTRFNRATGAMKGEHSAFSWSVLVDPADPEVHAQMVQARLDRLRHDLPYRVDTLLRRFAETGDTAHAQEAAGLIVKVIGAHRRAS